MRPVGSEDRGPIRGRWTKGRDNRLHNRGDEQGYVLILGMLVVFTLLLLGSVVLAQVQTNQQHVQRDRSYTQSLAIAEAGLNQYLWMVATGVSSEHEGFAIPGAPTSSPRKMTFLYEDPYDGTIQGHYTMEVTPPTSREPNVTVKVTGVSNQPVEQSRTISARVGRPSFSEYIMLTDKEFYIGGPLTRQWHGKTHSNERIRIATENIIDLVTSAGDIYTQYDSTYGWPAVPANSESRKLWKTGQPKIDFNTVTADLKRLSDISQESGGVNLPYTTTKAHNEKQGWYIKLLPNEKYELRLVTNESEVSTAPGGSLTLSETGFPAGISKGPHDYPENGLIYVNDNVWIEGADLSGRITVASSGQLNPSGKTAATCIHVVGDLTYAVKDGTVAVGLIAQSNLEIPSYAPLGKGVYNPKTKTWNVRDVSMEINCAVIAQKGKEFVRAADVGGPLREMLTIFGSVSSCLGPYRLKGSGGFASGANLYDTFLLHNPPPHFPTIGTYQILDWQELPLSQALTP